MNEPISSINKIFQHTRVAEAKSVSKKEKMAQDTISISPQGVERQKMTTWLEMLKEMPELREEKIKNLRDLPMTPKILREVSQKILETEKF